MSPRRRASRPVLIYCEGLHDAAFMRYLKEVYGNNNTSKSFDIKPGAGGSVATLVGKASRVAGDYDIRIVKSDNDRGEGEYTKAWASAEKSGIIMHISQPCIEALFLEILETEQKITGDMSQKYKDRFEAKHMNSQSRTRIANYHKIFHVELLESRRMNITELDELIKIFE